jgi:carboxyl-terminal processing protease
MRTMMKGKFKFLLLAMLIALASCSFTTKTFDNPDKDKLLIQLISYVLEQGHFEPKELDDGFSEKVFYDYLEQLDPFKRYFYQSDLKEFEAYKYKIDDQIKTYDLTFFNLTHDRLLQRIEESKERYKEILDEPFDYTIEESFSSDYEELDYVRNKREMKERWRKQLKFSTIANYDDALNLRNSIENELEVSGSLDEEKALAENLKTDKDYEAEARETTRRSLEELYTFIDERQRKDWFAVYINAIVERFDPHTFYFAPEDKERFDVRMTGEFEGIGARLQKRMDVISVNEIISGGPAWRQNDLEVGDQILKVRQEDELEPVNVVGMRLDDAIKFIKGPKGTKVILTVRKVDGEIKDISITRDLVQIEETYAKSSVVEKDGKNYGVITLPGFYADLRDYDKRNAASDVKKEIERLKKQDMQGLVIDLRDNGGGSLQTVVDMAGLFIKEGPVVQVKTTGEPKEVLSDKDKSILWDGPLVILVNELSASASEILAAAMQDYKRAIVIGSEQTYGKGTVQQVLDLNRMVRNSSGGDMGALKFTTQKYYRIDGGSTQLEGVKSDIVVPDRYKYIGIGERTYDTPMAWDKIDPADYEEWENYFDYEATIAKSRLRMENNEQLRLIDENAKWINTIRENNDFSLNYDQYKQRLQENEDYAKRFDRIAEYQNNLEFKSLPYELKLMAKDSTLKEKRERWHKSLSQDIYVEEALNVLQDLQMTYKIKNNLATTVKE